MPHTLPRHRHSWRNVPSPYQCTVVCAPSACAGGGAVAGALPVSHAGLFYVQSMHIGGASRCLRRRWSSSWGPSAPQPPWQRSRRWWWSSAAPPAWARTLSLPACGSAAPSCTSSSLQRPGESGGHTPSPTRTTKWYSRSGSAPFKGLIYAIQGQAKPVWGRVGLPLDICLTAMFPSMVAGSPKGAFA